MNFRLLGLACLVANVLATDGIYKQPKVESFAAIDMVVSLPANTTTPGGMISKVPIVSGNITGRFNGHLVQNISTSNEAMVPLPLTEGEFSQSDADLIFENDNGDRIFASLRGLTTYANMALHGFGSALLRTDVKEFFWVNKEVFLVEWDAHFNTGLAQFEFSTITTGGRKDGQPIKAFDPSK
ncbi:hypothetical protein EYZ11_003470 [Aspergillus tanneri]|uniref:Uncharacterized protein n=1 Tax=Aspergillus tanneri TaxID=1220188 RepID=A0A4S3JQ99_9EURO|nr:uncharacterized protein ATNIH1004_007054 [Aspergillus tanneri]KAA8645635.1 hypothetical protein ATNIH1004_007054 [Aspergillus tanneri]THC97027.1 hypothetical protein EYZ11_003470 [Aspergillus tanneri]